MGSFWQIKIYRSKFIAYTVFVVTIGLVLGLMTCAVLIYQWIESARNEAVSAFGRVESELQYDTDRIEAYMQRIYSNDRLMTDVRYFLGNTAEGYLTSRLEYSLYNEPLVSFPEDMRAFLYSSMKGDLTQVSLHTENGANIVRFSDSGNVSFRFGVPNTDEIFREKIEKGFVYRKKLSDPNQISRQIGEFRFLIGSEPLFRKILGYKLDIAAAVSSLGEVYMISGMDHGTKEMVLRAAEETRSSGFSSLGGLKNVFFMNFQSTKFDYRLVMLVDLSHLMRQKAGILITIVGSVLLAMISVLLLIGYNMRDDARFLRHIINSIKRVKTADFTPNSPARYRRNEYGMIARELDDMVHELDKHIRTEYLLKLKQQETEMKALQHQINPHFLYNTLESIRSTALLHRDVDTADAIATLGSLYRDIVHKDNIITIGEELELLQKFLSIMELKYPGRFYYQIDVEEPLLAISTVKFWMQPLAENFFVHGFNPSSEFNLLVVNGWEEDGRFVLEFVDNGKRIPEARLEEIRGSLYSRDDAPVRSIGLRNVYTRLSFFYGDAFRMEIENNEEAGVKITVIISKG
ncbi:histidine kinase [Paenibacillus sp. p3-SID1389]|uniref:sensor histidine kinase n=1 Tax=Paenibacillus sp. p3-SID1389 TaxID=2916364 RepID=UPI0021A618C6|nr:histidine kinase [Paenibacillus sp. p3-SID1389]MCT2194276.1 histidine kinase [Paenibacillus sp. p3-SID1389]